MSTAVDIRTIAIASGKGGVGKSFLALNLAWYLAELGQHVTLVELDHDAGALGVAAGLGEGKPVVATLNALELAARAVSLPGNSRVQLLKATDIPRQSARSLHALQPLLEHFTAPFRIVDLPPGIGAQNTSWLLHADVSMLIGTPELVSVHAMLRLQLQLKRQHAYEWLCAHEPRLRGGPASLAATRERLAELIGAGAAEQIWQRAFASHRAPLWIMNRVLPDDEGQLNRISRYLAANVGAAAAHPYTIPEDLAQARCARFGRVLLRHEPASGAAEAVRQLGDLLLAERAANIAVPAPMACSA